MRAEKKRLEHELYVTRQKLRRRAALRAIVVSTILGAVFGGLAFGRWVPPDDDFPEAPPPRFR